MSSQSYIITGGRVIDPARNIDQIMDIAIEDGRIADPNTVANATIIDATNCVVSPGFIDVHVHLRQPGNSAAETIATGTMAAAAGGFTSIVAMPNTSPAADTPGAIEYLRQTAARQGVVRVLPCGCLTKGRKGEEMTGIGGLKAAGVVTLSDDGGCVHDHALMRHVMEYAHSFGLSIMDHCEDSNLAAGGVMHEGLTSVLLGMKGICSMSEEIIVARDIMLSRLTGGHIHIQHISAKGSVELVRQARKEGLNVTAEATPHHIALNDSCIKSYNTNFKMNPPLRAEEDRLAILEGLADGTITVIATDHAPHTETAKLVEFDNAPFGIVGLETALGLVVSELYHKNIITLPELVAKLTIGPAEVIKIENYDLSVGSVADVTIFNPDKEYVIDADKFFSKSRNTPFNGRKVKGKVEKTFVGGKIVYEA